MSGFKVEGLGQCDQSLTSDFGTCSFPNLPQLPTPIGSRLYVMSFAFSVLIWIYLLLAASPCVGTQHTLKKDMKLSPSPYFPPDNFSWAKVQTELYASHVQSAEH